MGKVQKNYLQHTSRIFHFNRLTFGVNATPEIFRSCMETIFAGIPNAKCYLDDILIFGSSVTECYQSVVYATSFDKAK